MIIFLIGQTTLHWGRMEFGNIGNYYIIEPFIRELHQAFPDAMIKTTLQMSEDFCKRENVTVLSMDLYYGFKEDDLEIAIKEVKLVEQYLSEGVFSEETPFIHEVLTSDLVIDFSGDIWGDNADFLGKNRFEVGLYKDMVAQKLGKPTFMLAGSPGPFSNERVKEIAKEVFENFHLVTNREPISKQILLEDGFDVSNVVDLACPAFLFEPREISQEFIEDTELKNILGGNKPVVGFVLCGWNFQEGPFDKWPRKDEDYLVFAEAIEYISNTLGARVCLISHSNGFPIPPLEFKLIHGRDYAVIKQLYEVVKSRGIANDVVMLDGVYDAWTTKGIIAKLDMLISGRVHAAVAGLSQSIPTVILDYGHEPKAHKLRGFASVADVSDFVCDPTSIKEIISKVDECWNHKDEIKVKLEKQMQIVKETAKRNFTLVKEKIRNI